MAEDSDLNDVLKIENALGENALEYESECLTRCEGAEGCSASEASSSQHHSTPNVDNLFSIFEEGTSDPIEEDIVIIDKELEPTLDNAICLNVAYQSVLVNLAQQLEDLRYVNLNKQSILRAEIDILKAKSNKKPDKQKKKLIPFSFFGMPYFKDAEYNTPPPNQDELLAKKLGFRNISLLLQNKQVSKFEERRILKGVKEQAIAIEFSRLVGLRDELLKQLNDPSISEDDKEEIRSQMISIKQGINNVELLPDDKLFDVPVSAFDWHKISVQNFGRLRTQDQLRLHWLHNLRPGVNTSSWIPKENKMLKEIVSKYEKGVDWMEVATEMNIGRTPFDCFRQYQKKFNPKNRKYGWSNEDDNLLLSLISSYKTQNIYWEEIRQNFPGRSKTQIYAHFRYLMNSLDRNPFSADDEDAASLLNKLPMLKSSLLNDSEEQNKKKRNKYSVKTKNLHIRGKRVIQRKENEMKKILVPLSCMHVTDLTKKDQTPEVAEVHPKSTVKAPGKIETKETRKVHLQSLKGFGKRKTVHEATVSTTSVKEVNITVGSTSADGENSETSALPSTIAGPSEGKELVVATRSAKKAKIIPAKPKYVPKSDRVSRRPSCKKLE